MERIYHSKRAGTNAMLVSCRTKKKRGEDPYTLYTLRRIDGSTVEVTGAQLRAGWVWQHTTAPPRRNHRSSTRAARRHPAKK